MSSTARRIASFKAGGLRVHPNSGGGPETNNNSRQRRSTPKSPQGQTNQSPLWPSVLRRVSGGGQGAQAVEADRPTPLLVRPQIADPKAPILGSPATPVGKGLSPPTPDSVAEFSGQTPVKDKSADAADDLTEDASLEESTGSLASLSLSPAPSRYSRKTASSPLSGNKTSKSSGIPRLKVVLDMDECLIHSIFSEGVVAGRVPFGRQNSPPPSPPPSSVGALDSFQLIMLDKASCIVNKRPLVDWFLQQVCAKFDTYVMTAGTRDYAEPLLDRLDPNRLLKGRFYRDSCVFHDGHYFKDLTLVDKDPRRVLLVDNNPASFVLCPANGIPVTSFYDDPTDRGLEHAWVVLQQLENVPDVRKPLRQLYGLEQKLGPMTRQFQNTRRY